MKIIDKGILKGKMLDTSNIIKPMDLKNKKLFSQTALTSTMEDYLETIYSLSNENEVVRVKDIANSMRVKMPTVTSMLKKLNQKGMIDHKRYESIELTPKGLKVGSEVDQRHRAISAFLTDILLIEHDQADQDACRMEHSISRSTLDRIVDFMTFVENCPRTGNDWLVCFSAFQKDHMKNSRCWGQKDDPIFENCPEQRRG